MVRFIHHVLVAVYLTRHASGTLLGRTSTPTPHSSKTSTRKRLRHSRPST